MIKQLVCFSFIDVVIIFLSSNSSSVILIDEDMSSYTGLTVT